ncbi:hypothetical protein EGR_08042 [Echinococcus granulosus]|uniref:Uncharacterized protein n=1 Tax=Echinococcus granulosus TaxID=6210 RepID=W6UUM5_ECHGR|nr:hypothetical protein EGR_08042 [Echinococcus granulosus]EUB57094.1 hypothetical protein EGR_08042 [Echinococcus granulosus]
MGVKTGISAFARANAVCCQLASAFCYILALGLIIGGAILISKNSAVLHRWPELCGDGFSDSNFVVGIALVFFGCLFTAIASIMICCACGFLAFSDSSKSVVTITQQPQPVSQMPMGSYSNQPQPPQFMTPDYDASQPQIPSGPSMQPTTYPSAPVYPLPSAAPPPYDQAAKTPNSPSMSAEKY